MSSSFRVIHRYLAKPGAAIRKQSLLLTPGAKVGEYVPLRNSDPALPTGIVGGQVGQVPDVQEQQVYTQAQIEILQGQGFEVIVAKIDNHHAEMEAQKVRNSKSLPDVRPELRQAVQEAYDRAAQRRRP